MSTYRFVGVRDHCLLKSIVSPLHKQTALIKCFPYREIPTCSLHKTNNKISDGNYKEFDYSGSDYNSSQYLVIFCSTPKKELDQKSH